jgi:hypothetical protein
MCSKPSKGVFLDVDPSIVEKQTPIHRNERNPKRSILRLSCYFVAERSRRRGI